MSSLLTVICAIVLCILPVPCGATPPLPLSAPEILQLFHGGQASTTLDLDNDSFVFSRSDRFYTSGVRLGQGFRARAADGWRAVGWHLGQQIYTPSSIELRPEQVTRFDRPYAGWLYAGVTSRARGDDGSERDLALEFGCLGPCAGAHGTQQALHHVLFQPLPMGWQSQLRREWGVVLHAGGRLPYWRLGSHADLRPGFAVRLGNVYTDAVLDALLRAGRLQARPGRAAVWGFLRASARAVGYDATLQGGLFNGEDGRTVQPERRTHEFETGLQWQRPALSLRVSLARRSNQIKGLTESDGAQYVWRITVDWSS